VDRGEQHGPGGEREPPGRDRHGVPGPPRARRVGEAEEDRRDEAQRAGRGRVAGELVALLDGVDEDDRRRHHGQAADETAGAVPEPAGHHRGRRDEGRRERELEGEGEHRPAN
jgi:hypothetical protein